VRVCPDPLGKLAALPSPLGLAGLKGNERERGEEGKVEGISV